jgi:predicted AlkP superfamily phosphohydrolase/phosphomutase
MIGLDSATLDLILPWAEQGLLPNLNRLLSEGASARLMSSLPPITPPAWTSFMTGKNPGKHGIFHFVEPQAGSYMMRYSNAGSRKARTFWRILSDAGVSVGAMNIPFTYPPEEVNGFQISGMDTPSTASPFIYPPSLREEIERVVGKIVMDIRYLGYMSTDDRRDQVLAEMEQTDNQWTRAGLYLLDHHPADVMMFAYTSADTVQHYFWHYMDRNHFLHDPGRAERYGNAILGVYQRLDRAIGVYRARLPEETTIMVVSDHGAGPVPDRVLYLNRYLAQLGLLKYRGSSPANFSQRILRKLYTSLRNLLTSRQKSELARLLPALRRRLETAYTSFANVDWSQTKAYCSEVLASPPNVWINLKGTRPSGIVEESEYESLITQIVEKLEQLRDPRTGTSLIRGIYRRNVIYQGPYAHLAPDLTLDWWGDGPFSSSPSYPEDGDQPAVEIRPHEPLNSSEWSGTHKIDGTLIVKGPPFRPGGPPQSAHITDIAPMVIHLMGLPVPEDMDGKVPIGLFQPEYLKKHPIRYQPPPEDDRMPGEGSAYTEEEAAKIEERLKGLGYIE